MMKEIFYSSIGTISLTSHKFKELVEDLIQNEQLTKEEGKRLYDEIMQNTQVKGEELKSVVLGYLEQVKSNIQAPAMEKLNAFAENFSKNIPFLQDLIKKQKASVN
ncbi:MAG: hypothetical protein IPH74_00425 [Bacteroidetes bacterium]|jgi:polyhydroxyalkanoate synthesis regulator phasin|nr:hypothetical protein [Bacteroidota bacterium]MBP7256565.1 hypothetical protein [Chitinophagales bacterium]MBK7137557.1 hypothetical protein [Bacteroidota bacterium]MBK7639058.1 hypothetical protein [Bacteroidota bacterium]MBK8674613.1 hypothetical protein [Bacteroidota bacterium]